MATGTSTTVVNPFADDVVPRSKKSHRSPPPIPPMTATSTRPRDSPHRDITEAVRDTVTVQQSSRNKIARSHTQQGPNNASSRPPAVPARRSQSQDSVLVAAAAVEKAKGKRPKKGSQHADVIDRLDFTGVGSMFHHDGPFDACAPSRNRHRMKAPMLAWSSGDPAAPASNNDSAYPSMNDGYVNNYQQPKKKVDAIAEAWGTHEPEPFEEFSAGGGRQGETPTSSIYNGRTSHRAQADAVPPLPRSNGRRTTLPPPQPIFVPDAETDGIDQPMGSPGSPGLNGPKRSKSLMHRIRKMRDSPNVPVGYEDSSHSTDQTEPPRLGHRSQNSFLGMFNSGRNQGASSPPEEKPEPFVFVEDSKATRTPANKELPAPPAEVDNYFDSPGSGRGVGGTPTGLGRKTSLMKKMKGVVRGGK